MRKNNPPVNNQGPFRNPSRRLKYMAPPKVNKNKTKMNRSKPEECFRCINSFR